MRRTCGSRPVVGSSRYDQFRIVHQGPRDRQPPLHATRQFPQRTVCPIAQFDEVEQLGDAIASRPSGRQIEVARVHAQVLDHREVRDRRCPSAARLRYGGGFRVPRRPQAGRTPSGYPALTGDCPMIMRRVVVLPAPFGPSKPKQPPAGIGEVDSIHGDTIAESLGQAAVRR